MKSGALVRALFVLSLGGLACGGDSRPGSTDGPEDEDPPAGGAGGLTRRGGSGGSAGAGGTGGGVPVDAAPATADSRPADSAGSGNDGDGGPSDVAASDAARDAGSDSTSTLALPTAPAGAACPTGQTYDSPLPQNRTARRIRGNFTFVEGPVWVAAQKALYFSEFQGTGTNGRIHKYTPGDGQFMVFVNNVGTNGLALDGQGMILAGSHDMQRITRFDPATGQRSQVEGGAMYMGRPFNAVNDLVARADGNVYFTDPSYQLGGRTGQGVTAYYRLSSAGMVTRIATTQQPNGINLSPDGKWLYVASSGGAPLVRLPVNADGSVGAPTMFAQTGSDGMAVDCAGNIYVTTAGQVRVLSPEGRMLGSITGFSGGGTTNVAFGGEDGRTLFITAGGALWDIRLNVPGLPN